MFNPSVLSLLDMSKYFIVETNASDSGSGAVLIEEGHLITYISKVLGTRHDVLSTH